MSAHIAESQRIPFQMRFEPVDIRNRRPEWPDLIYVIASILMLAFAITQLSLSH